MSSATPRTAAASRSSRARTTPRSPSGTSAGSLIEPASPRDAHTTTTRAPASTRRANVPPHASDSSSGCAKIASTVRPARRRALVTTGLHEPGVNRDVLVHHAGCSETGDRALADAAAIEIEKAWQVVGHLLEVVENHPGYALVDDFADGAAVEGCDRC